MKRSIKNIILAILIIYVFIELVSFFEIFLCNKNMKGSNKNIDNDIYHVMNSILDKKYEYLLYNNKDMTKTLYCFNKQEAVEKLYNSEKYNDIYDKFDNKKIYNIEKAYLDLYIVYYNEVCINSNGVEEVNKYKAIIKYNKNISRAVICLDTGIEEG